MLGAAFSSVMWFYNGLGNCPSFNLLCIARIYYHGYLLLTFVYDRSSLLSAIFNNTPMATARSYDTFCCYVEERSSVNVVQLLTFAEESRQGYLNVQLVAQIIRLHIGTRGSAVEHLNIWSCDVDLMLLGWVVKNFFLTRLIGRI
ncbi:hypothetical protein D917_06677 [Trichinella nativa]|uniref:Uncharacterized protein n=1 Tax=Trichinella nativa TaxID=6335 RepID=A0A1Y3ERG6_9BILA|nr:hypothetical protein D917_06677 [Trichinella nativa]